MAETTSPIYVSPQLAPLAAQLSRGLVGGDAPASCDPMIPLRIVVPNRNVRRWLQLWIARHNGVAMNLQFQYLETALWDVLSELSASANKPEPFDQQILQSMLLEVLLGNDGASGDLKIFGNYLPERLDEKKQVRREFHRQAWQLAERLADHLRNYEYHRPELIRAWRSGKLLYGKDAPAEARLMEPAQRALFDRVLGKGGLREKLSKQAGPLLTLAEFGEAVLSTARPQGDDPRVSPPLHVFVTAELSSLHADLLHRLAAVRSLRLYVLTPHAGVATSPDAFLQSVKAAPEEDASEWLRLWAGADRKLLRYLSPLLADEKCFELSVLPAPLSKPKTVLGCVQSQLLGQSVTKRAQDLSLQVVGCPSTFRELETVHNSILQNLRLDPSLRPTDVAVLVPNLSEYRVAVYDVFERGREQLPYNLTDVTASEASAFGKALQDMLDLAGGRFSRSEVCRLLTDPCFLAAVNVDRATAGKWVQWAHTLNICHAFDRKDKQSRGYADTPLYTWQQGLQRLRLGRIMDAGNGQAEDGDVPDYQHVIPFSDLDSQDAESLGKFCWTIETLYRRLDRLKALSAAAPVWRDEIRALIGELLDVPEDRPEEGPVRSNLLAALDRWAEMGLAAPGEAPQTLQLPLVREMVRQSLAGIDGSVGACLVGGVTIGSLQRLAYLPFSIVYIVGLGEGDFPGRQTPSAIDLRSLDGGATRDVTVSEANRLFFLQALLSCKNKLYLTYVHRDLQKDQVLYPASLVNQLLRVTNREVLNGNTFQIAQAPLDASDPRYLGSPSDWSDVLVNYSQPERLLCLLDPANRTGLKLSPSQQGEIAARQQQSRLDGSIPPGEAAQPELRSTVRITDLKSFLRDPLKAALNRHLRLYDEEEPLEIADEEPFYTVFPADWQLITGAARRFLKKSAIDGWKKALADFDADFDRHYSTSRLCNQTPDGAFDEVDRARLLCDAREFLEGGLLEWVAQRPKCELFGAVILGQAQSRPGALPSVRFPSLDLNDGVQLSGQFPLIWRTKDGIEATVITTGTTSGKLTHHLIEPFLMLLALQAGSEANPQGQSSRQWLGSRSLRIHTANREGVWTAQYDMKPASAREYLARLAADFLNQSSFDLLPFDVISKDKNLKTVFEAEENDTELEKIFSQSLTEVVEQSKENSYSGYRPSELLGLIEPQVPTDAYHKIRRRYRPLASFTVGEAEVAT